MADRSTAERLADDLQAEGLDALATAARTGHYDEWRSSIPFPLMTLYSDLMAAGRQDLAAKVAEGEWDSTREEADAWAASHEGRETFDALVGKPNRAARRRRGRHGR